MNRDWLKYSLILSPVIFLLIYASYYLYKDYKPKVESESGAQISRPAIGSVLNFDKNVKRKPSDQQVWDNVQSKDSLYDQDSIRTGLDSQVLIQLSDNSLIQVQENSLIVLEKKTDSLSVDFKTGDIEAKGALKIKIKDSVIDSNQAELKLKTDTENQTQVVVKKGSAKLTGSDKKQIDLTPDKLVKVDQKGLAEAFSVQVILNSPKDSTTILEASGAAQTPFTWTVLNEKITSEFFEISKDSQFTKNQTTVKVAHQGTTVAISKGVWFWRVGWDFLNPQTQKTERKYSEVRTFKMLEDKRISLVKPAHDTIFELDPLSDGIHFEWTSEIKAKVYVFEISSNHDFTQIVKTTTSADLAHTVKDLKSGTYFWRVRGFGEKNEDIGKSAIYTFSVKLVLPRAPQLLTPENSFIWSLSDPLNFEWSKYSLATKYSWTITKDVELKQVVTTQSLTDTKYSWRWTQPGIYYWYVQSQNSEAKIISKSLIYKFEILVANDGPQIKLTKPLNLSEVKREKKENTDPVSFEWVTEKPLSPNYTFLISDNYEMKNAIKKEDIKQSRYLYSPLKSGNYYWKVLWTDPKNTEKSMESRTFVLKYKLIIGLPAPKLITPSQNNVTYTETKETVEFTWEPTPQAVHYRIMVEKLNEETNTKALLTDEIVDQTTYKMESLDKGQYFWSVKSVNAENEEGPSSEKFNFTLKPSEILNAPKIKPAVVK